MRVKWFVAIIILQCLVDDTEQEGWTCDRQLRVVRATDYAEEHGAEAFHDERVQQLEVVALEADERHGYTHDKSQPQWEAEVIDPVSKFVVSHVQGQRDEALMRRLLEDSAKRLANRHQLVLFTEGEASYASLFPEIFGQAYRPRRQGNCGRFPNMRYRYSSDACISPTDAGSPFFLVNRSVSSMVGPV